jgi:hypothetical protein
LIAEVSALAADVRVSCYSVQPDSAQVVAKTGTMFHVEQFSVAKNLRISLNLDCKNLRRTGEKLSSEVADLRSIFGK